MRKYGYNSRTRRYEWHESDLSDNAGEISVDTSGDVSIGIGGGLGIDTANGDLTMKIAPGISVDLGGGSDPFNSSF